MEELWGAKNNETVEFLCRKTMDIWHDSLSSPAQRHFSPDRDRMEEKCLLFNTDGMESIIGKVSFWDLLRRDCDNPGLIGLYILEEWYDGRMMGEDGAFVSGNVRLGTTMDQSYNLDVRFTVVYERVNGQWEIIHIHNSLPQNVVHKRLDSIYTVVEKAERVVAMAEELESLARIDQMTGVYNHKTFLDIAENLALKNIPNSYCYIIDLDNFKNINDTYGHLEGDEVLKALAEVLKEQTREGDLVGRIGGDEFAVLCRQVPEDEVACQIAGRILTAFQKRTRKYKNEDIFGLSIGIAGMNPGENIYQIMQKADRSLYQAKSSGKKTYCIYREKSGV